MFARPQICRGQADTTRRALVSSRKKRDDVSKIGSRRAPASGRREEAVVTNIAMRRSLKRGRRSQQHPPWPMFG
eukprot:5073169-Prymnesium_polylepis.1